MEGGPALAAALRALGDTKEISGAVRTALRKGAEPVRDKAKALAPKEVHNLEHSIKIAAAKKTAGEIAVVVGIDRSVDPPRMVGRKNGRGAYRDPGVAGHSVIQEFGRENDVARPYMRPAMDSELPEAPEIVAAALWPAIERAARRLAGRAGR